jgi:hypothetical protein
MDWGCDYESGGPLVVARESSERVEMVLPLLWRVDSTYLTP